MPRAFLIKKKDCPKRPRATSSPGAGGEQGDGPPTPGTDTGVTQGRTEVDGDDLRISDNTSPNPSGVTSTDCDKEAKQSDDETGSRQRQRTEEKTHTAKKANIWNPGTNSEPVKSDSRLDTENRDQQVAGKY